MSNHPLIDAAFRELEEFPLDLQQILSKLICPQHQTLKQREFLAWLTTTDDYFVHEYVTKDALEHARYFLADLPHGHSAYANHDVDWRSAVHSFVMRYVPAIVWSSYRNWLAYRAPADKGA